MFEVTAAGERVWEFLNPHLNRKRQRASIVRMTRYETSLIEDGTAYNGSNQGNVFGNNDDGGAGVPLNSITATVEAFNYDITVAPPDQLATTLFPYLDDDLGGRPGGMGACAIDTTSCGSEDNISGSVSIGEGIRITTSVAVTPSVLRHISLTASAMVS